MSIWQDKPLINKWILEALEANQIPELFPKIKWQFNNRFHNRMGDANYSKMRIRLSSVLWNKATQEQKESTVKHETCHIIAHAKYGDIKAHGAEWKRTMISAGQVPERLHKVQTLKKAVDVRCTNCQQIYKMGYLRAARMKKGQNYSCNPCGGKVEFVNV